MLRREIVSSLTGVLVLPAIVHSECIMPVRPVKNTFRLTSDEQTQLIRSYLAAKLEWSAALHDVYLAVELFKKEYSSILSMQFPNMTPIADTFQRIEREAYDQAIETLYSL